MSCNEVECTKLRYKLKLISKLVRKYLETKRPVRGDMKSSCRVPEYLFHLRVLLMEKYSDNSVDVVEEISKIISS